MNVSYIYLQIYRLFDEITPIRADCGQICSSACCKGEDSGMYLFPGEEHVYELLNPDWITIENSDFCYEYENKSYTVQIAMCSGMCDRYQRPLACRMFPLTPYIDESGRMDIIVDPRSRGICPLAKGLYVEDFDDEFVKNLRKAFTLLAKSKQIHAFLNAYSRQLDEYKRFFV